MRRLAIASSELPAIDNALSKEKDARVVNVTLQLLPAKSPELKRSCVTVPTPHQRILLDQLGLKMPLQWTKCNQFVRL